MRPLLCGVARDLNGVASAHLLEPFGDSGHDMRVLLDVVAELVASQRALRPTPVEAVLQ